MRISYKGRSKDYDYRVAEVTFNDENKKEQTIVERAIFFLERTKGYRIDMPVPGYAICEVEDMDEFKMFSKDWREAVKNDKRLHEIRILKRIKNLLTR